MGTGAVFDTYMNVFFWEFPTEDMKWFSIAAMVGVTISLITIKPLQTHFEKRDIFITCLLMGSILQIAKSPPVFEVLPKTEPSVSDFLSQPWGHFPFLFLSVRLHDACC